MYNTVEKLKKKKVLHKDLENIFKEKPKISFYKSDKDKEKQFDKLEKEIDLLKKNPSLNNKKENLVLLNPDNNKSKIENKEIPNNIKEIFIEKSKVIPEEPKLQKSIKSSYQLIKLKKIKGKQLQENPCVKYVRSLPKKWKKFFIKETTEFNFTSLNENCNNFLLILFILQIHHLDLYKNLTIKSLKVLLTHFYQEYLDSDKKNRIKIAKKWSEQSKEDFSVRLLNNEDIGNIIQNETYTLSEIDIFLIAYKTKTPIIVYKQSKKSVNSLRIIRKKDEKYYYFIRIGQKNNLNLNNYKRNTLINIDKRLTQQMKEEINKNIIQTFDDYLYI